MRGRVEVGFVFRFQFDFVALRTATLAATGEKSCETAETAENYALSFFERLKKNRNPSAVSAVSQGCAR